MVYFTAFFALAVLAGSGAFLKALDGRQELLFRWLVFTYAAAIMIFIAGTRAEGVDRDYSNYEIAYRCFSEGYENCLMEPAFGILTAIADALGYGFNGLIFLYALLAITIYATLIYRSETPYLSLITYFGSMFLVHEMTQIRAGLAFGIALWGLDYLYRRERVKFVACCLLASTVHVSCLAFIALVSLSPTRHNIWLGMLLIAASIAASFHNFLEPIYEQLFAYILGSDSKYVYYALAEADEPINRFGLVTLALISAYLVGGFGAKRIAERVPKIHIYLNAMLLGICAHYVFYFFPGASFRVLELFGSVMIFFLPALVFAVKLPALRFSAISTVLAFNVMHFVFNVSIDGIVEEYRSVLF